MLFNAKASFLEEQQWYYLTNSWEDRWTSYLSQGHLTESERNIVIGVQTRLLRFLSSLLNPLHPKETPNKSKDIGERIWTQKVPGHGQGL